MLMSSIFFFNDSATTALYTYIHTLSLHDALPIWAAGGAPGVPPHCLPDGGAHQQETTSSCPPLDRAGRNVQNRMPVRLRPRRSPAATSRRPPMRLRFLGCGDAFGSGGRFNTCFLASGAGTSFLIDCGASSLVAMRRFGVDPNDRSEEHTSELQS